MVKAVSMFNKSITCTVDTDAAGQFQVSTSVQASRMFAVHVDVQAMLVSPSDTALSGTFAIAPAAAFQFTGSTNEKVELGKWRLNAGDNTASATGTTNPVRPNCKLTVRFEASLA
jgi:hypothetical protein